jgi:hypothetical protein
VSSQSTSHHSKATDGTYKTATYFEQIPEDEELPNNATNKLQIDLHHHLQLKLSADQYIVPSTIKASKQIPLMHFPSPSVSLSKLCTPSSKLQSSSSIHFTSSTPPFSIPTQGTTAGAETSVTGRYTTSKRSTSGHSRQYKIGELLIGNDYMKSAAELHIARYVHKSSESREKSSISKSSGQKSRKTAWTNYSNPGSGVPPTSIRI